VTPVLLQDVLLDGVRADVRVVAGRVAAIGRLDREAGEETVAGGGGTLAPGFVDEHLHLHALAATADSVDCGPPHDRAGLAAALAAAPATCGWVRGTGYAESVAGDLDAANLDRLHADRPVRIQHRSGALWVVNRRGAAALGLATADHAGVERDANGVPTGRLWRADAWLRGRLPTTAGPDLRATGRALARLGITAVTDATPDLDPARYGDFLGLPQRVTLLGVPLGRRAPAPLRTGPYKIVLADSGLPTFPDLVDTIRGARAAGRAIAAHCVTREALLLLLAALAELGPPYPGDRIEHAAVVPAGTVPELARRGLRVVTQPGFVADRGDDYRRDVPPAEHADLYRAATLLDAGVDVRLSSDAPYGPVDPAAVLAAAADRRTRAGAVLGPAERLTAQAARSAYAGPPLRSGRRADLVLYRPDDPTPAVWIAGGPVT
jgi:predicted amidohydrolase YtcJ